MTAMRLSGSCHEAPPGAAAPDTGPMAFCPVERVRAVQCALAEITETAESEDGLISVTVGSRGELVELWLDPRIYRNPDSLAEEILTVYGAAREAVERRAFEVSAPLLPAGADPVETDLAFDPVLRELDRLTWEKGLAR